MRAATEGNKFATDFREDALVETPSNSDDLAALNAAIDASGIPDKQLAETLGVSRGEFAKLRAGRFRLQQIRRLPLKIRIEYRRRLQDCEPTTAEDRDALVMQRAAYALIDALVVIKPRVRPSRAA